jgi:aminoglycoside phosphotransferase family enzyme
LSIDGEGTPVEYAVEMARFYESRTIDHLAGGRIRLDFNDLSKQVEVLTFM